MIFQNDTAQKCILCNNTNFYKQDGYFFCTSCQTQNENIIEEVFEERFDVTTRVRKTKIKTIKSNKTDIIDWTSWELYNFALLGLTNQLIEIGADPKIKLTILQLWTQYLSKLEVAFTSKNKKCVPKLARRYHKNDADIIYGKIEQKKKKRRKSQTSKGTSSILSNSVNNEKISTRELNKSKKLLVTLEYEQYVQSQGSSDTTGLHSLSQHSFHSSSLHSSRIHFNKKAKLEAKKIKTMPKSSPFTKKINYRKKYVTTQYAIGPEVITPLKLLSIIYLALRIDNSNIYISDILRFSKEGHLSYYNLNHLIPSEIILTKNNINLLTKTTDITHKGVRRTTASLAKFLNAYELSNPDLRNLIERFCTDLELPRGIFLYTEKLLMSSPSVMKFTSKSALIPNYEGRAMAYIIVVLKILFILDDFTEIEISRVVEKINRIGSTKKIITARLFSFCEWQQYIECRKTILTNLHFPSKMKYDPECVGLSHLYLRFMGLTKSKKETETLEYSHNLAPVMHDCFNKLNNHSIPLQEMEIFLPTFTPLKSYINQLKDNSYYKIPDILKINFNESKVGFMTKPNALIELAAQCEIKLKVVDYSIQYIEKIVPLFEQTRMLTLEELSKLVKVKLPTSVINQNEMFLDYSHKNRISKLKINFENFKYYSYIYEKFLKSKETLDLDRNSFFYYTLFDGRLNINSDSNFNDFSNKLKMKETMFTDETCLLNKQFSKKYNIKLYNHEIESLLNTKPLLKEKYIPHRDETGKFVKLASIKKERNIKNDQKNKINPNFNDDYDKLDKVNTVSQNQGKIKKDISILANIDKRTNLEDFNNLSLNNCETLFRPYKDYWIYHCIFSRVKGKNFELLEKELPENFLWLLNECANVVEMSVEDLYEEVCLIESYHFNIFKPNESKDNSNYDFNDYKTKKNFSNILNKW